MTLPHNTFLSPWLPHLLCRDSPLHSHQSQQFIKNLTKLHFLQAAFLGGTSDSSQGNLSSGPPQQVLCSFLWLLASLLPSGAYVPSLNQARSLTGAWTCTVPLSFGVPSLPQLLHHLVKTPPSTCCVETGPTFPPLMVSVRWEGIDV